MADTSPSYKQLLDQFSSTLDALLELAEVITPHVKSLDRARHVTVHLRPPPGKGVALVEAMQALRDASDRHDEIRADSEQEEESRTSPARAMIDPEVEKFGMALIEAFSDDPQQLRELVATLDRAVATPPARAELLNGALLTTCVGALEALVAGLAVRHFIDNPKALESQEREFSLADLLAFDDLADARAISIDRRVEDLMRGSLDEWKRWFERRLGEEVQRLARENDSLNELMQRRHIVVHNAGRVSRLYKAKTGRPEVVGTELPVDRVYLERSIDEVEIFGTRLGLLAWIKWGNPEEGEAAIAANGRVYELLQTSRWNAAEMLAATGTRLLASAQLQTFLQVNEWQAAKRARGTDAIRTAVEAWDTTALAPTFDLAKATLLENWERVRALIPRLRESGDLTASDLKQWPLFIEARGCEWWSDVQPADETDGPGINDATEELE